MLEPPEDGAEELVDAGSTTPVIDGVDPQELLEVDCDVAELLVAELLAVELGLSEEDEDAVEDVAVDDEALVEDEIGLPWASVVSLVMLK